MHHIELFTPCIELFNCDHLLYIRVDHAESKTEIPTVQVQWRIGGHKHQVVRIIT
jgi:hypothetical protein